MKIDIHIHTKKVKSGESQHREITPKAFCDTILSTDVRICAITNHNIFDLKQYNEIKKIANGDIQVWPGVELDIGEGDNRGHLLVIVNPKKAELFSDTVLQMVEKQTPDNFSIEISKVITLFDDLDPLYIPHYSKTPSISDGEIEKLQDRVSNSRRILKEVANSISAGVFISHGHKTIYGSDIKDWKDYISISKSLPDLRLPVDSYEQFCLLIERDDSTIESILSKKNRQVITVKPFSDDIPIEVEIYNDLNIFFGSKGTGKTEILKALSKHFNRDGHKTTLFESNASNLDKYYDLKGREFQLVTNELPIDICQTEFSKVRRATDKPVTSIKKYYDYFSETETNKASKMITARHLPRFDDQLPKIRLNDISELKKGLTDFETLINSKKIYSETIGEELFQQLSTILQLVKKKIVEGLSSEFIDHYSKNLFNSFIEKLTTEVSKKTGKPEKPITTGFSNYANNRIEIEIAIRKIIRNIETSIKPQARFVGNLGPKGNLFCKTELRIQDGSIVDSSYRHLNSPNKNPQKYVAIALRNISENVYTNLLFEKIDYMNNIENSETITSIEDLILFRRFFETNHKEYIPSTGESAMILLTQELESEKEIFIIDEPEKSLGNDYINDFIVPLLKSLAYSGKTVIIATHDANIAVRTLPYKSIYREHDINCYHTYMGNPFSNTLHCKITEKNLDWKEMSMRTLEGGKEAFGERGKIYGNS